MKVIDLLKGKKVRSPKGVIGYFASMGNCVVLLSKVAHNITPEEGKKDETLLYPQVVEKNEDILNWDVIESEDVFVNCADLISHKYIFNTSA